MAPQPRPARGWQPANHPSILFTIPREMLDAICEQVEEGAPRIRLALTCKFFLNAFYPNGIFPRLDCEEREKLLLDIEGDLPGWYYCFGCVWLRPFDLTPICEWSLLNQPSSGWIKPLKHKCTSYSLDVDGGPLEDLSAYWRFEELKKDAIWDPDDSGPAVSFTVAHLVMNQHLYGPLHGLPKCVLEGGRNYDKLVYVEGGLPIPDPLQGADVLQGKRHITRAVRRNWANTQPPFSEPTYRSDGRIASPDGPDGLKPDALKTPSWDLQPGSWLPWRISHDYKAKIIDNELYLARFSTIRGPATETLSMLTWLLEQLEWPPICAHLSCLRPTFDHFSVLMEIDDLITNKPVGGSLTGSCRTCFTDFHLDIKLRDGNGMLAINMDSYHCLGSCRSPCSDGWRSLMAEMVGDRQLITDVDLGQVCRKWLQNDGQEPGDKGIWTPTGRPICLGRQDYSRLQDTLTHLVGNIRVLGSGFDLDGEFCIRVPGNPSLSVEHCSLGQYLDRLSGIYGPLPRSKYLLRESIPQSLNAITRNLKTRSGPIV